jgi:hypothetical protein
MTPKLAICIAIACVVLVACGRDKEKEARSEAERQARATAAAAEMLAADSAKFREEAKKAADELNRPPPEPGPIENIASGPQPANTTRVAVPPSVSLVNPPTPAQTFGFDDSPDGLAAKELMTAYINRLKDPDSAKFREVKGGRVRNKNGGFFIGGCGESNARNSYGGYTGFSGFVAWQDEKGTHFYQQSSRKDDELQNMVWQVYAKQLGCLA